MELTQAYQQIEERLDKIDFSALCRGFHRFPFALYNDTQACINGEIIEKPANFLGNTSIRHNGEHTAIWHLSEGTPDFDVLTSKVVHEMLHAYQNDSGEARWADERAALVKYRYEEANFAARLEEAACIKQCLSGENQESFERLLALRKARMERFPFVYDYEAKIEQIEGTAHFVEHEALAQLDAEKAEQGWEWMMEMLQDPAQYFPVRSVTYLSGAAFIACLRKYTELDTDSFTDTPFAVAALAQADPCAIPERDERAAAALSAWQKQKQEIVTKTIEKGEIVLEGRNRLVGWNVYDGTWDGKYAVLTVFLGYIEGTELPKTDEELFAQMKVIQGNFVAELDEELYLSRVWRQ